MAFPVGSCPPDERKAPLKLRVYDVLVLCLPLSFSTALALGQDVSVTAEVAKLLTPDGSDFDEFGGAVSVDGDRIAVGAALDDEGLEDRGAVFVFERGVDGSWSSGSKLLAQDDQSEQLFGSSVSLDGDRLAIGATGDSDAGFGAGSVYVFETMLEGSWLPVAKLVALDGFLLDRFGTSVSLQGDRIAVGAPGGEASYLFERGIEGSWEQVIRLEAADGLPNDAFGTAVSLAGDRLAVGASLADGSDEGSGAVYLFERGGDGVWSATAKVQPSDGLEGDRFGHSVVLDGERLVVGAFGDGDNGALSGSVYIFEEDPDGQWIGVEKVLPADGQANQNFGSSIAVSGARLVVGADGDSDAGFQAGAAYLFEREAGGSWILERKLLPLDGQIGDSFGFSVSIDGERLAIGANQDDDLGSSSGSAYVFESVDVSPELSITGVCPGEIQLTSVGTTPRSRFALYSSQTLGVGAVETGTCAGTPLALETPNLLRLTDADFDAEGTIVRTADRSRCGVHLQVVDERTCLTSGTVQVPVAGTP